MNDNNNYIKALEEEVCFLREERRRFIDALEMAASIGNFSAHPGVELDRDFILNETADKLRTLVRFKGIAFYLINEDDNSFFRALSDPPESADFFDAEIDQLIEDHTFAWILKRSKPVIIASNDQKENLIFQALATPSRVRGMFAGILDQDKKDIPDTLFALFSIVILSSSSVLESIETYDKMRILNNELQKHAQKSQELYQDIFENAPIAIFRTDPQGRFLKLNPMYAKLAGYESAEEMAEKVTDIARQLYVTPSDRLEYLKNLEKEGAVFNYEVLLKRTDGKPFWASMNSRVVKDENNNVLYVDGFLRDITEKKQARYALVRAKEDAEAASRAKSEFLANMSHELRTPLNGILGMMQLVEMSGLNTKQQGYIDNAIKSGQRLTELLSNILDLSKIEKGRMVLEEKPVLIRRVIQSIAEIFAVTCFEKGITFDVFVDERIPQSVMGDDIRIKSILFNLVGNAVKFTEQGQVKLDAYLLNDDTAGIIRVLFIVRDTGVGIADEAQARIFEPFVQAEGCYTRKFEGAGLGLSVVRRMLDLMGGTLCFDSVEGKGSSFYTSVPFRVLKSRQPAKMHESQSLIIRKKTARLFLLVEDEPTNLFFAEKMMEKLGFKTISANDGKPALSLLEMHKFDGILMDIRLKELDGIQTTKIIRSHDGSKYDPNIPIIAMTAYAMSGDREKILDAGMDGYIAKPLHIKDLKALLEKVMG